MEWSLYQNNRFLKPLKFSNGKTQEDVVREVLNAISEGHKVIFIHGICGTGKSAIALNIAKKLGKTSIVVPIKNLQEQYKKDYEKDKYVLKNSKEKLKISVITGRNNHKCRFLEDNKNAIPKIRREIDSKLHDIFEGRRKENLVERDVSADNRNIPCKIEIKEGNWKKIREYIKKNKDINLKNIRDIQDVKRISVAGVCPYWCPVLPEKYELGGGSFVNSVKRRYRGINDNFVLYCRNTGCSFYEQFNSYIDSDVIVFNSMKYKLESLIGRKPFTEAEIIDECDEFLDSFANQRDLNIDRLQNSLIHIIGFNEKVEKTIIEIKEIIKQIKRNQRVNNAVLSEEIIPLKETGVYDLLKILIKSPEFFEEIDEESYFFDALETAKTFENFYDESYLNITKRDNNLIVSIVTVNLAKKIKEMIDKNKTIILMSGTLHSEKVLKDIFGLGEFKIIEAESEKQGRIDVIKTGLETDCKYANFSNGRLNRENYLKALDKCLESAKKPVLVHVNAFTDLPTQQEIDKFKINNLISREELMKIQKEDRTGKLVEKFKKKQIDILFSTRAFRGIDFPGEECNSIVFTKYPNPNVKNAFWRILAKTRKDQYWDFYKDKAHRELWQKIYRGLRFKEDHIYVLSPDVRVLREFER